MSEIRRSKFGAPRVVLLIEVERYCRQPNCPQLNRVSLTKAEARAYTGFECERCKRWNDDILSERDVPEWWEELAITDMTALRENADLTATKDDSVINRVQETYKTSNFDETDGDEI